MKKFMMATGAAALLAASSLAAHAEEAEGAITSIDVAAGTVTLDDGNTYILPGEFDTASLDLGAQVSITFELTDSGMMEASEVEVESAM